MLKADVLKALEGRDGVAQLVKHYDQCNLSKLKETRVAIQVKFDGVQLNVINCEDGALFLGRSGKELYLPEEVKRLILPNKRIKVAMGELCFRGKSLEELTGLVNPNRVNAWTDDELNAAILDMSFVVFDGCVSIEDFIVGHSSRPYSERLQGLVGACGINLYVVEHISTCNAYDDVHIAKEADWAISQGYEGIIIRTLNSDWKAGRRDHNAMKIVRGIHLDLKCTDFKYGKGKRSEQIAALEFEYKGRKFWSDLGKGWTDEKRDELTAQSERTMYNEVRFPIGEIFHVKGLQESSKGVIRLPKVQEHRIDKDVQDE